MTEQTHTYRYGDFPELFPDLDPRAEVDAANPRILARVLTHGSLVAVKRLVPGDVLRRGAAGIDIPDHARHFWEAYAVALRNRETGT